MSKKMSRREWSALSLSGLAGLMLPSALMSCKTSAAAASGLHKTNSKSNLGVIIGAQTYSFRDRDLDGAIKAMNTLGITSCELWRNHVEPWGPARTGGVTPEERQKENAALKQWRSTVTMDDIKAIRKKINDAGINIQAYNGAFGAKDTDAEFDLVFRTAQALGTDTITTSATVSLAKRISEFAQKYKIKVGMHNHSHVEDANQVASPDSFMRTMAGNSEFMRINLDIGHFTAANFDAVDFLKKNHEKIVCVHIKDRKKNQGENVPLGEGDTPITEVLRTIRDNKWAIPANIEYEYKGGDTVVEVKKCLDYCKKALS